MTQALSNHNHQPSAPINAKRTRDATVNELTDRNIALIAEADAAEYARRTTLDRFVDVITNFCGRIAFVWLHVVWFTVWISMNSARVFRFDPYPFNLLSMIVSAEAIFLATFILMSQNRQTKLTERRSHLDLQINLLSEQENTKMLSMLVAIQEHLGIAESEIEDAMLEDTQPEEMLKRIDERLDAEVLEELGS